MGRMKAAAVFSLLLAAAIAQADPIALDIDTALSLAEEKSFELSAMQFRVRSEQRRYRLQLRDYFPKVSLSYSDTETVQYYAPDSRTVSLAARVKQPLFRGGRTLISRNIQKSNILLQQQNVAISRRDLIDECYGQFYTFLLQKQKEELLLTAQRIGEAQLDVAETELRIGTIRRIDYLETSLQVQELRRRLLQTRAELEQADYALKKLLGFHPDQEIALGGKLNESYNGIALDAPPEAYASIAVSRNPNIAQARQQVDQSRAQVTLSRTTWVPDISLEAAASVSGRQYPLQDPGYSLTLEMAFPYEWFPLDASVGLNSTPDRQYGRSRSGSSSVADDLGFLVDRDLAQLELMSSVNAQTQLIRDVEFQVRAALAAYGRSREELRLLRERIALQEQIEEVTRTRVAVGEATRIDLIETQNELLDYRLSLLESVLSLILAERSFEQLLGIERGTLPDLETAP